MYTKRSDMEANEILLSICIPTYNRCKILASVLEQYVSNAEFDESVEIVISDNASTDDTQQVCQEFARSCPNIRYYRNEENIRDLNFERVISLASGQYIKLINDWLYFDEASLRKVKERVREHLEDRTPLFFSNNWLFTSYQTQDVIACEGLNGYVSAVSTYVTSNNVFGVWREQWPLIQDRGRYRSYMLLQEDWTYQLVSKMGKCIVYNDEVFTVASVPLGSRGGYNWFKVHLDNYYRIMQPYIDRGEVTRDVLRQDKHYLLRHFKHELFDTFVYKTHKNWNYETDGTLRILLKYYWDDLYFYRFMLALPFHFSCIKEIWK